MAAGARVVGSANRPSLHGLRAMLPPVEVGEAALVVPLAALFFVLAAGYQVGQSAAYALFVDRFGPGNLPFAFLVMPFLGVAITTAVTVAARRLAPAAVLSLQLLTLAVVAVGLRVGIDARLSPVLFMLPAWDAATNSLNNMVVWSVAARLLDVRQTKRLGALVAAGRSAGLVVAGLAAPPVVAAVGAANLYLVQFATVAVGAVVLALIARTHPLVFGAPGGSHGPTGRTATAADEAVRSRRYVRSVLVTVGLTMLGYVVIRNIFLYRAAVQFPSVDEYAAAIGVVGAVHGLCTLATSLFVAGRFMVRFGVRGALATFALGALAVYVPFALLGFAGVADLPLFLVAAGGYSLGGVLMYGLRTPALQVLYQPLVPGLRTRVAAAADGTVEPVAVGIAAVALLGITKVLDDAATGMACTLVAVAVVLLAVVPRVSRRYVDSMHDAVHRRALRPASLDLADRTTVDAMSDALSRAEPVEIVGLLAGLNPSVAGQIAARLLGHPAPDVRRLALARLRDDDVWPAVERIARHDADPAVRAAALVRLDTGAPVDLLLAALEDPNVAVRRVALDAGLTGRAPAVVRAATEERLASLASSPSADDRRLAARLLHPADPARLLDTLACDADPGVRAEVRRTHCRWGEPSAVADAVAALGSDVAAVGALVEGGARSVDALATLLALSGLDGRTRQRAVRCLQRIGTAGAIESLRLATAAPDALLRGDALAAFGAAGGSFTAGELRARLRAEVDEAARQLRCSETIRAAGPVANEHAVELARRLVEQRVLAARDRALLALGCGPARETMRRVRDQLGGGAHRRATAIELLDASLDSDLRRLVLPLVLGDPANPASMLRSLPVVAIDQVEPVDPLLASVIRVAVGARPAPVRTPGSLGSPVLPRPGANTEVSMTVIERLVVLAGVDAFAQLPGDVLADVAELVEVVHVEAGIELFAQGDTGTSMFVVVQGELRVHVGDRVIDRPGPREVLGELALLDAEPRSASVTAETDAVLYRLDAEPFSELLSERPEVLRAILRTVIGRLRARTADVAALRDQLDGRFAT